MNQKHVLLILFVAAFPLLSACGVRGQENSGLQQNQLPLVQQDAVVEPSTNQQTNINDNGYPVKNNMNGNIESYPVGEQTFLLTETEQNAVLEIPEPAADSATVSGIIIDITTQRAPFESDLYLGIAQETNKGLPVVTLDREQAPVTTPLKNGQFVFTDVPPGTYGIVLFNPDISFLLDDPNEPERSMMITIQAGQVVDLGVLQVTLP